MNLAALLRQSTHELERSGISTARLDALILFEDVTNRDRAWLLANPNAELLSSQIAQLNKLLKRRAQHEPLAYIRGKTEFYGREFVLTPGVLEPRPESETMIDMLKSLVENSYSGHKHALIADVGTGSGALGITAALEVPSSQVELLEIDHEALKVAQTNVDKFTLKIPTYLTDLLDGVKNNYDILLCNLPYVPDGFHINLAATHEPELAIFGGPDGLDVYRKLFLQLGKKAFKPLYILLEALPFQHAELTQLASKAGYECVKVHDFIQLFEHQK